MQTQSEMRRKKQNNSQHSGMLYIFLQHNKMGGNGIGNLRQFDLVIVEEKTRAPFACLYWWYLLLFFFTLVRLPPPLPLPLLLLYKKPREAAKKIDNLTQTKHEPHVCNEAQRKTKNNKPSRHSVYNMLF